MLARREGIQQRMESRDIHVAPDRFEITRGEALLITELHSALAVCVYDAAEEAGALLHLRCILRTSKPADVTDTTLATELLLLDRCLACLRETVPTARHLQARIVVHLVDAPQAKTTRGSGDVLQLPVQALHQRYLDLLVCHVVQPVISSRVLPRLAAMSSGERIFDRAEIVARTTLIGLREP